MAALTESDLLGRRIDLLSISPPLDMTIAPQVFYTVGLSPNIIPNPTTGGAYIAFVSLQLVAGSAQSNTAVPIGTFGTYSDWSVARTVSGFPVSPWMFYPNNQGAASGPGIYPQGTRFYFTWNTAPFNAGSLGVFRVYGWVE